MDDFGIVQFRYTCYVQIHPVNSRVDDFRTVFGPFWYIMKSDSKKAANGSSVTDSSMFDLDT